MEIGMYKGEESVIFTKKEFTDLQNKILAQKELIKELAARVGMEV